MAILYEYGVIDKPVPFKITKSGVAVASLTFSAGDINISVDGAAWVDITSQIAELVGVGSGKGWDLWTPTSATYTTGSFTVINVAEVSGTNFDENGLVLQFGGNAAAWLNG